MELVNFAAAAGRRSSVKVLVALVLAGPLVGGCGRQLMPSPNIYVHGDREIFDRVPSHLQGSEVRLLYATDRSAEGERSKTVPYGYGRSPSLAFGQATVTIGEDVDWDTLVEASHQRNRKTPLPIELRTVTEAGRFPETPGPVIFRDGRRSLTPEHLAEYAAAEADFHAQLSSMLSATPCKEAYIYVHGFANDFEDAALTMAEFWHFLGRQGVPIIYSWPAGRQLSSKGYMYDRESGEFTIFHFKQFLRSLAACPDLEKVHILAHSRGTAVTITTLRELHIETAQDSDPRGGLKLGHVILAAADIDMEVGQQRIAAEHVPEMVEWFTLYSSGHDLALHISDSLSLGEERMGEIALEDLDPSLSGMISTMPNNTLVHVTATTGGVGHSYFHSHPAVASDLILLMRDNRRTGAGHGRPLRPLAPNFWELHEGYPTAGRK